MPTILRKRTARVVHRCEHWTNGCPYPHEIQPGQEYLVHDLTPNDPDVGNVHWWRIKECLTCYEQRTGKVWGDEKKLVRY